MKPYILAFAISASCSNPNYCEGFNGNNCSAVDSQIDVGVAGCTTDSQCLSPMAVCDTVTKECVNCTAGDSAACTATTPVCKNDACNACASHTDCDSSACLPDGSCAAEADTAYAQAGGSGSICTKTTPCATLATALATARPYVKLAAGLVQDTETTKIDGQTVTILADTGAKLGCSTPSVTEVLLIQGAANVRIFDLEVVGGSGSGVLDGAILVAGIGGIPHVELTRVVVRGAAHSFGIYEGDNATLSVTQCTSNGNFAGGIYAVSAATIVDSTFADNGGVGIDASGTPLVISRNQIYGNVEGIGMGGSPVFTVSNNFIYRNGTIASPGFGGVVLPVVHGPGSTFEFNTVVDNVGTAQAAGFGGVRCDDSSFIGNDNIIFRNVGGPSGAVQTSGACTWGNSLVSAGSSSMDNSLGFRDPNTVPYDYHLTVTTPATVIGAAGLCAGVDFDGETRPIGSACEIGADEYHP